MSGSASVRLRRALALTLFLAAMAGSAAARAATPGSPDRSFAGGAVALGSDTQLFGVGVERNGEVIAAGQSGGRVLVQCFGPHGALAGRYLGGSGVARAVTIQPDGKAVVAGASGGMFVERFHPDCTVDASFHAGEPAVAGSLGPAAVGNGVATGPRGTIIAAGSVPHTDPEGESTRPALARFTSSGQPDNSFGSGGTEVIDHGHPYALATAVAVQADGRIVLAGRWQDPAYGVTSGWIERLTASGQDDASFAGGQAIYNYAAHGAGYASLNAVALQRDGEIVAAGSDLSPPPGVNLGPSAAFVRLNADGTPDAGFGSAGTEKLSAGTFTPDPYGAYGVGIAGGGRVVGAGAIIQNGAHDSGLWALTQRGSPASRGAFGADATVLRSGGIEACAMAVAPHGKLVIVGDSVSPARQGAPCEVNSTSSAFAARYFGFGPPPTAKPPAAITGGATGIGEASATVNGSVNPNGLTAEYHFDYGRSSRYGSSTPAQSAGSGSSPNTVSAQLTGLSPGTTYHYRLVATNTEGTTTGSDGTFTTASARPSATTGRARAIGEVSATIAGLLSTSGLPSRYYFDYGPTAAYGHRTPQQPVTGSGSDLSVSAGLTGLRPGTTYHYRLVASNADGTSRGADMTFTTEPRVSVVVRGLRRSYSLRKLDGGGLGLTLGCSQPCEISESIVVQAKTVKRLHLGTSQLVLGTGSVLLRHGGRRAVHLHLTGKGRRLVAQLGRTVTTVRIVGKPTHGGPAVVVSRHVTLER